MKRKRGDQTQKLTDWIANLKEPGKLCDLSPIAQRFVSSLRLVAVYHKAGRDPVSELTLRMGSMTVAVRALQLIESFAHVWPDPLQVRRCCCQLLSHDEMTVAAALQAATDGERYAFEHQLADMLPDEARESVWASAIEYVTAEFA